MLYVDTMKVLLGILFLMTTCSSISAKDPDSNLKRTKSTIAKSESLLSESTEESPHRYSDHYESNKNQQPKGDHRYNDPQQRRSSNEDYGREKDDQIPQAYKFGYEVNDEHEGHQYRHEEKDEQGNVQGQFGYRDAKGQFRQVEYVADGYGFRAKVKTNEAGVDKQNPADVEIHKEEGHDFQKEYTKNVDTGPTGDANVLHHSEKSSSSNYYHQQPAVESKSHVAPNHYYRQPAVESEPHGATHQYHRQPVEDKPHDASDPYYRQPVVPSEARVPSRKYNLQPVESEPHVPSKKYHLEPVESEPHVPSKKYHLQPDESEPHVPSKKYHLQPVESEPHDAPEHYHRQPVVESEPHNNNYEYELKNAHPYTTYVDYGYPHITDQESDEYHQTQNEESESPGPATNQYFMKERSPQSGENDYSSENDHSMPRTEMYKKAHKIVPPQPYVEKSSTQTPSTSTYQYELQMDGRTYKYVKKPSYSGREQPQAYQPSQEYHTNRPEHTEVKLEEMKLRDHDYQRQTETNAEENYDSREQKLILPQSGVNEYNIHSYQSAYPHSHEDSNQNHPNLESGALKYDYNDYSLSSHSKELQPEVKAVPVAHQYVQIDEHELSNPSVYNTDHVSYRHRPAPQEPSIVQPQQIVMMEPRKKIQMQEKVTAYGDNTYHHTVPQISSLQSLTYNGQSNEHQPMKKAVLELNPEVYKKLLENKSPGQRIVAIPVNGENAEHSAPSAEPPHGVLHITLDGQSSFNPKAAPIILHIGNKQSESSRNAGRKYQAHIPLSKSHHAYSQFSAAPMYKPNAKLYRNKDNKNWIPMTPAWRSRMGRTSTNEDSTQVSSGEGFKFLQAESSNRKVNFQRQPPKITKSVTNPFKRVIPGIYIINTSKRVSKSKDSKSTQGHTLISLTRP